MKHNDHSTKVGNGYSFIKNEGAYSSGEVLTPHGYVMTYSEPSYSSLRFIWRGCEHQRTWKKGYTDRGLVMLAKRFAKEKSGEPTSR
jgi:hypothetical protein